MKGMIQVYTGNGKGKTTAAIGLGMRALGAEKKVLMIQFLKDGKSSEIEFLRRYAPNFKTKSFGSGEFLIEKKADSRDYYTTENALQAFKQAMESQLYDIIILDELNVAIDLGLVEEKKVIKLLKQKPVELEIIITGRNASKKIKKIADLVTEMKEKKHYFKKGIPARKGIEY